MMASWSFTSFLLLAITCFSLADQLIIEGQLPKGADPSILKVVTRKPIDIFNLNPTIRSRTQSVPNRFNQEVILQTMVGLEKMMESLEERVEALEGNRRLEPHGASNSVHEAPIEQDSFRARFCGNTTAKLRSVYQLDASYGTWNEDFFCRAIYMRQPMATADYSVSAEFFNVIGPQGINSGYIGLAFNVKDEFNFDVVYLRLHRPNRCYQSGYVKGGRFYRPAGSLGGTCPRGPPKGRTWFHLKVIVHGDDATLYINGIRIVQFQSHFPAIDRVAAVVVAGSKNIVHMRLFNVTNIRPLPFDFNSCSSYSRVAGNYFHMDARRRSTWPSDGFCTAINKKTIQRGVDYEISVDLYLRRRNTGPNSGLVGVVYNAQNAANFDFLYFRPQHDGGCYTIGHVINGKVKWAQSAVGSCPGESIKTLAWFNIRLHVTSRDVVVLLNNKHLVRTNAHFPTTGRSGVAVGNSDGNGLSFKDFSIFRSQPKAFEFTNCAAATKSIGSFYLLDGRHGEWPKSGFCRALSTEKLMSENYAVSVTLYIQGRWGGELTSHVGVLYNAKDANNFEFIYFRPHSRNHCYTYGLVLNGEIQWSTITDGNCSGRKPKPKRWFNVRVSVRKNTAWIELGGNHLLKIPTRLTTHQRAGVMAANDNLNLLAFKDFKMYTIKEYPFEFVSCGIETHQRNGSFVLGTQQRSQVPLCLAILKDAFKSARLKSRGSYFIQSDVTNVDSWLGREWGNIGMAFNAKDENNYEFFVVRLRPSSSACVVFGFVFNGVLKYTTKENKTCELSWKQDRSWQQLRIKVTSTSVSLLVNGIQVTSVAPSTQLTQGGGMILSNGLENLVMFRAFTLLPI